MRLIRHQLPSHTIRRPEAHMRHPCSDKWGTLLWLRCAWPVNCALHCHVWAGCSRCWQHSLVLTLLCWQGCVLGWSGHHLRSPDRPYSGTDRTGRYHVGVCTRLHAFQRQCCIVLGSRHSHRHYDSIYHQELWPEHCAHRRHVQPNCCECWRLPHLLPVHDGRPAVLGPLDLAD